MRHRLERDDAIDPILFVEFPAAKSHNHAGHAVVFSTGAALEVTRDDAIARES